MQNFKEIGPAVCSGEYPGMKNGGASYNMSQPVDDEIAEESYRDRASILLFPDDRLSYAARVSNIDSPRGAADRDHGLRRRR